MPRLKEVQPEQASGEVQEIFEGLKKSKGKVFNIFKGMGNSAAALNAYLSMSGALAKGELAPEDREVVYLTVSQKNGCVYCLAAHTAALKKQGLSDEAVTAIRKFSPESEKHAALSTFVLRVMETNGFVDNEELEAVKAAGYTDGQIAEAIAYIGLATYSNLFNHVYETKLDFPEIQDV